MNIKQLRYVTSILATGSFSAAAAREGVSVQAVSKAMAELESEIGAPLFTRASSGVSATALGRSFGTRAGKVLREYDDLERFVRAHGRDETAPFRMGFCCPEFPNVDRICALIRTVSRRVLGREVTVSLTTGINCVDDLRDGRIDALVTIGAIHERGIVCGSLGTMAPHVLVAADDPLARKDEVTIEEISERPVLLSRGFDHFNDSVCRVYVAHGLTSELVEVSTLEEMGAHFARGGVAFVVGGELLQVTGGLAMVPIAAKDRVLVPICLSTLRGAEVSYLEFGQALSQIISLA